MVQCDHDTFNNNDILKNVRTQSDNHIKQPQFVREMQGHNSDLMYYEPGTSQTPGYRLRIDAATLDTGRFLNGIFRKCWNGNLANFG